MKQFSNNNERLPEIDVLRGISALLIVMYHYTTRYDQIFGHVSSYIINFPWGYMAVSTFFILSGFLICMHNKDSDGIISFAFKRVVRLYPAYWAAIIITASFTHFFLADRAVTLTEMLINFTMLQGFFNVQHVDGVYWILKYEILFYALIGVLIYFKQMQNILPFCFGWSCISILLTGFYPFISGKFLSIVTGILMPNFAHMFILGMAMYLLYQNSRQHLPHIIIALCIINQYCNFGIGYTLFFLVVTIILYSIVYRVKIRIVFQKQITFVASVSYPLYLIHQNIGYGIIKHMESWGFLHQIFLLVPITISIGLAYLLHRYVEEPSRKALSVMDPLDKWNSLKA